MTKTLLSRLALIALIPLALASARQRENNAATVAEQNNAFAIDLFDQLRSREAGNLFFSPFSISTALAMTYAGARKGTSDEMERVMRFGQNTPAFHYAYGEYLGSIEGQTSDEVQLRVANRIWVDRTYEALLEYELLAEAAYGAPMERLNFRSESNKSRLKINDWVADRTEQRILDLLPEGVIDEKTRMVLTNAIYFKADWQTAFDTARTRERDFFMAGGGKQKAEFMHRRADMNYRENQLMKMVRLPYKGNKHSMILVLPQKRGNITAVEENLNLNDFNGLYTGRTEVNFAMPKFKMTIPLMLSEDLKTMGMKTPFTGAADFSGMSEKEGLAISEVIHKAFIEVDETGTEAAAATAVVMMTTSSASFQPNIVKEFHANHPFLYFIMDDQTRAILFMGRMMSPGKE